MTTVINFKTEKDIKVQAQKVAGSMGLTLSDVLNIYLRNFIKVKALHLDLQEEELEPSDELIASIKEARKEYKSGKMKRFKSIDDFSAYLDKL